MPVLTALDQTRDLFRARVQAAGLLDAEVCVTAKTLSPEEAIGQPGRRDFPILIGKERVVEANVANARGQAFTDSPREFIGTLADVLALRLDVSQNRAIYVASLNAVMAIVHDGLGTVHCKDDDPEVCGRTIAQSIRDEYGLVRLGLIGLNPAIAEHLVESFGPERLRISDLNPDQVGRQRWGVPIWNGAERMAEVIDFADVVLYTGTTLVNGTYDAVRTAIERAGKTGIVYGMTAAGVAALLGFRRLCPCARSGRPTGDD